MDGFSVPDFGRPQRAIVDGDATSAAIAAASIVAKVTRDRYMRHADAEHPGWGFAEHVGYSTPVHREAILRQGVSPLHRMSFQSLAYQQLPLQQQRFERSPRAFDVVEAQEPVAAVDGDADRVEADRAGAGADSRPRRSATPPPGGAGALAVALGARPAAADLSAAASPCARRGGS